MWRLEADGTFLREPSFDPGVEVAGADIADVSLSEPVVTVRFGATADGRGFSAGRILREKGFAGRLVAAGPLIPDQARHAFQCGFDAIVVSDESAERHGLDAWRGALRHSVREIYVADPTSRGPERGIWAARHLT
jgi:uncharacterized protein (DUF934 family)